MTYNIPLAQALKDPGLNPLVNEYFYAHGRFSDVFTVTIERAKGILITTIQGYLEAA